MAFPKKPVAIEKLSTELLRQIRNPAIHERFSASRRLISLNDPTILPQIIERFRKETNSLERIYLINLIGDFHNKSATPVLIETLNDKHQEVRFQALGALQNLKDKRTIPKIREKLKDPYWRVRCKAIDILAEKMGRKILPDIQMMLRDDNPNVRERASIAIDLIERGIFPEK